MYDFVSEKSEKTVEAVPFFEDATAANGWAGTTTGKSIETLKSNIIASVGKLGGLVTGFEKGSYGDRPGYIVHYVIETPEGKHIPGYISVAALPLKPMQHRYHDRRVSSLATRLEKSLQMALYNIDMCLSSQWKFQRLSPGFAPLMPFMIMDKSGHNLTQIWSESANMKALMPPSDDFTANGNKGPEDIIDAEIKDV